MQRSRWLRPARRASGDAMQDDYGDEMIEMFGFRSGAAHWLLCMSNR